MLNYPLYGRIWRESRARSAALHKARQDLTAAAARQHARQNEWAIRTLLGFWQSELEPTVMYGPGHELLGLGYGDRLVVPLRWIAHAHLVR